MEKLSAKKNNWQKPSLSLRDISPRGKDKFGLRVRPKETLLCFILHDFSAKENP